MNFGLVRLFCARIGTPLWLVYGASHEEESIDSNMVVFPFHQTFTSKPLGTGGFIGGLRMSFTANYAHSRVSVPTQTYSHENRKSQHSIFSYFYFSLLFLKLLCVRSTRIYQRCSPFRRL